jgi:hypothetical protein
LDDRIGRNPAGEAARGGFSNATHQTDGFVQDVFAELLAL